MSTIVKVCESCGHYHGGESFCLHCGCAQGMPTPLTHGQCIWAHTGRTPCLGDMIDLQTSTFLRKCRVVASKPGWVLVLV